jgi:hypothetical protein
MPEPKLNFKLHSLQDFYYESQSKEVLNEYAVGIQRNFQVQFQEPKISGVFQVGIGVGFDVNKILIVSTSLLTVFDFTTVDNLPMNTKPNIQEFVRAIQIATAHLRAIVYFESFSSGNGHLLVPIESDELVFASVEEALSISLN